MKPVLLAASVALAGSIAVIGMAAQGAPSEQAATSAVLTGRVVGEDGRPVAGAMVTVTDQDRGLSESVFSNVCGDYHLSTKLSGNLDVRVRQFYFADINDSISLAPGEAAKRDFTMASLKTAEEISDQLPAAYHFAEIAFEPGTVFARDKFQKDCVSCHQLGNAFTRWPRPLDNWITTIQRMYKYSGHTDVNTIRPRAELLAAAFNGKPISARPKFPYDPELAKAKIYEYRMTEAVGPHDAAVDLDNGLVYSGDGRTETMTVTNLQTGKMEMYKAPLEGVVPGGRFAKMDSANSLYGNKVHLGIHSLALGKDGRWYLTEALAGKIGTFDPKTDTWGKSYPLPGKALYPHTIRVDKAGIVWFTIAGSNQVGRLDPKTGDVTVIQLPVTPGARAEWPYGIDVDPKDGSIWYAKLISDRIGRIDPETLEVHEWPSPAEGSRRMRFDKSGTLWVTGYSKGEIMRIEPEGSDGFKSDVIEMPEYSKDARPAPYALGVNPITGDIWVNDTMTDHTYRYIPKEKRWIAYAMPLRGTVTRDTSFTRDGWACMTNQPAPVAALEGGVVELICIDPEGNAPAGTLAKKD